MKTLSRIFVEKQTATPQTQVSFGVDAPKTA